MKVCGVLHDEFFFVFRQIFERLDRVGRAGGNRGAAGDAALRVDIHLGRGFEAGLVCLAVDAVGRVDLDTVGSLLHVSVITSVSWNQHFRLDHGQSME